MCQLILCDFITCPSLRVEAAGCLYEWIPGPRLYSILFPEYLRNDTRNCLCFCYNLLRVKGSAAAVYVPLLFTAHSKEENNKLGHYFKQGFPLEAAPLSNR